MRSEVALARETTPGVPKDSAEAIPEGDRTTPTNPIVPKVSAEAIPEGEISRDTEGAPKVSAEAIPRIEIL